MIPLPLPSRSSSQTSKQLEENSSSLVTDIHRCQSYTFASPPSPPAALFKFFSLQVLCANLAVRERKRKQEVGREESKGREICNRKWL
jgi:hypothetical protein